MTHKHFTKFALRVIVGIPTSLFVFYLAYMAFFTLNYPAPNCENRNPVFASHPYDSKIYKAELVRLLKENRSKETEFWFDEYVDANHIAVIIQNDKVCAKGHITVRKWEGFMNHLKGVQGQSYGGALVGFRYSLIDAPDNPEIVLLSVQNIID